MSCRMHLGNFSLFKLHITVHEPEGPPEGRLMSTLDADEDILPELLRQADTSAGWVTLRFGEVHVPTRGSVRVSMHDMDSGYAKEDVVWDYLCLRRLAC